MNSRVENHTGGAPAVKKVKNDVQLLRSGNTHGRAHSILEQSLNEIYLVDAETLRFEYVNRTAQRNLGYEMAALRKMTPVDLAPEFDETSYRAMVKPLLCREMEVVIFEASYLRADGTRYPVEVHLQYLRKGESTMLSHILAA